MNKRLFLATTAAVAIATSAFAQSSPSTSNSNPPTRQQDSTSTTPSSSAPSSNSSSANSAQTQSPSSTGQSAVGQSSNSGTGTNTTQAPASNNPTNQAQTNQPSNQAQTNSPSNTNTQTQSANPPATGTNQARSPTGSGPTNTAQQPNNQQNTADRSSNTNVNASVNINDQQRTRISTSISHLNVQPLNNVNFSLSVGTAVPRDVRLQPLPAEVVEVVPQYRGYNFVLVKDEIVIVEPSSYQIVAVLPYSGRSTASARTEQRNVTFSDRDREVVRKHAKARPEARPVERERQTTGSAVRTEIRRGERLPADVEVETFPEEVYREAPSLREYRYINRDSRTYIVEPQERRVIEEID
ncbi:MULTISPECIES: DUF1236 domain-containing protein [unclassified Bradyrhizobium]|uniref:DUF1236 domain-containing protein n=1 Tax=unclassified Bradyrhizobium TaxID=2631580 RepID=UPI001FFBD815|nr:MULTISPECIES: DUF1236 domain-containing protein [unclassified Bradyrhizobium]MCK1497831.1 DUF1236 domain-containing protein [Bradyrhizobium sp. 188]UPJ80737.1 DUF1236 domain-containing protein [Bradyrhizobium sp. 184]UPJ88530.1 DUF1236 domain-containing protein [Bradyrhizobium sp. 183]